MKKNITLNEIDNTLKEQFVKIASGKGDLKVAKNLSMQAYNIINIAKLRLSAIKQSETSPSALEEDFGLSADTIKQQKEHVMPKQNKN